MSYKTSFDIQKIRKDFPIFNHAKMHGQDLVYFDTAVSAQKPKQVLDHMQGFYQTTYANVHRGVYEISYHATMQYEAVRQKVADFIQAPSAHEIVYTKNATEGINLVAHGWGRKFLKRGDVMLLSHLEHHANIVPWQMLRDEIGIEIKIIPILDDGSIDLCAYEVLLKSHDVKFIAITQMSNSLGILPPLKDMINMAKEKGTIVLVDGSQGVVHQNTNVQDLGCDFYVLTGHKLYGPSGVGALWGKYALLDQMAVYQTGGDMISRVTFEKTTFQKAPMKFEAGTPPIVEVIGLGAALDYLTQTGKKELIAYEDELLNHATKKFQDIETLKIYGTHPKKAAIISFTLDHVHSHDIATFLDQQGIAVRAGHHCNHPLMDRFNLTATTRLSIGMYNTFEEIDRAAEALKQCVEFFGS